MIHSILSRRSRMTPPLLPALVLAVCLSLGGGPGAQAAESVSLKLPPKLQQLLRAEMQAIDHASQQILSALVMGDDARVATLALQIHDSFIMNQSMTKADEAALLAAVPAAFVEQDEAFHEIAGALSEAARSGDRHGQQQQFSRMIEACSGCHARYATDRFPLFRQ